MGRGVAERPAAHRVEGALVRDASDGDDRRGIVTVEGWWKGGLDRIIWKARVEDVFRCLLAAGGRVYMHPGVGSSGSPEDSLAIGLAGKYSVILWQGRGHKVTQKWQVRTFDWSNVVHAAVPLLDLEPPFRISGLDWRWFYDATKTAL